MPTEQQPAVLSEVSGAQSVGPVPGAAGAASAPRIRRRTPPARWLMRVYLVLISIFSLAPLVVIVGASVTRSTVVNFPPHGFTLRWYREVIHNGAVVGYFENSLILGAVSATITVVLSLVAAYALIRYVWWANDIFEVILQSPLLLPSIVTGLAISQTLSATGYLGSWPQLIIGHVILTFPFGLRAVMASLRGVDRSLEEAASVLGGGPLMRVRRILLPLSMPGIVAGWLFAFVVSLDNVTISLWMVGPEVNVFPVWLFSYVQSSSNPLPIAAASLSVIVTIVAAVIADRFLKIRRYANAAG